MSFPWASLVGLACVFTLFERTDTFRRAGFLGWWFGLGYFVISLFWIVEPFMVDVTRHGWMAPFALFGLAGGLAIFWGLAFAGAFWLAAGRWHRAVAFALAISVAELLRSYIFTGFPWALIGHVWIDWAPMQLAAFVGPHGLTFMTLIIAALGAAAIIARQVPVLAIGMLIVSLVAGHLLGSQSVPEPASPKLLRLVQPNAPQHLKWHPDHVRRFFDRQVAYSAAPAVRAPDLIIWPETSVPTWLSDADFALDLIAQAADGAPVLLGIQRRDGRDVFNSMIELDGSGTLGQIYDKHHLVPFGEYIPALDLLAALPFGAFVEEHGFGYSPGPGPAVLDLGPLGKVLPVICYEAIFPQDVVAADRPDWLLQITNDAWFGHLSGPFQHLAQARLRAVEQGLPMVRVANTGVSAVITPRGQVVASLALGQAGYLDAQLPGKLSPTLYARTGDWAALALYLLLGAGLMRTQRRFSPPLSH